MFCTIQCFGVYYQSTTVNLGMSYTIVYICHLCVSVVKGMNITPYLKKLLNLRAGCVRKNDYVRVSISISCLEHGQLAMCSARRWFD